mmetsp:Transcript_29845/g.92102  ORF Transcript_29845/g.92102 Transcript_29845/m.92102 type:complete len:577 (-) Transcript_29845:127-1857(-)
MADSDLSPAAVAVLVLCGIVGIAVLALLVFTCVRWRNRVEESAAESAAARRYEAHPDGMIRLTLHEPHRHKSDHSTASVQRHRFAASSSPRRDHKVHSVTWTVEDASIVNVFVRVIPPTSGAEPAYRRFVDPIRLYQPGSYEFHVFGEDAAHAVTPVQRYDFVVAGNLDVAVTPPEGTYDGPLEVTVDPACLSAFTVSCSPTFPHIGPDGKMVIDMSGIHVLTLTPRSRTTGADPRSFKYTVLPPAPCIIPHSGSVTDSTKIEIVPRPEAARSSLHDIRYSVDGRYPTTPYSAPFFPPGSEMKPADLVVKAIAVGRDGTHSKVVEAPLKVESSGFAVYDKDIEAPTCVVKTVNPFLTFDHERYHRHANPVVIWYKLHFRGGGAGSGEVREWKPGDRVRLVQDNVQSVAAWAQDLETKKVSAVATYTNWKRTVRDHDDSASLRTQTHSLPVPSIIVNASDVHLRWDEPQRDADALTLRWVVIGAKPRAADTGLDGVAVSAPAGGAPAAAGEQPELNQHSPPVAPETDVDISEYVAEHGGHITIQARFYKHVKPHPGMPLYVEDRVFYGQLFSRDFDL